MAPFFKKWLVPSSIHRLKGILFVLIPPSSPRRSKFLAKDYTCSPVAVMQGIMVRVIYQVVNTSRCYCPVSDIHLQHDGCDTARTKQHMNCTAIDRTLDVCDTDLYKERKRVSDSEDDDEDDDAIVQGRYVVLLHLIL